MKKKLQNVLLTAIAFSTGIVFSQTNINFTIDNDSGSNTLTAVGITLTQTITQGGDVYKLTAIHSSDNGEGQVALYNLLGTGSNAITLDNAFYFQFQQNGVTGLKSWTITLEKNDVAQSFTLNSIDYAGFFDGAEFNFYIDGTNISSQTIASNTSGTISFTNANNVSDFVMETNSIQGTQYVDFHNISVTIPETTLSISENDVDSFQVIASPKTDYAKIKFNKSISNENEFYVYDFSGRLITSKKSNKQEEIINLRNLKSGVYFIKVANKNREKTVRIIKK